MTRMTTGRLTSIGIHNCEKPSSSGFRFDAVTNVSRLLYPATWILVPPRVCKRMQHCSGPRELLYSEMDGSEVPSLAASPFQGVVTLQYRSARALRHNQNIQLIFLNESSRRDYPSTRQSESHAIKLIVSCAVQWICATCAMSSGYL
jgi:hypothetical protein